MGGVHNRFELLPQLHATSTNNPLQLTINSDLVIDSAVAVSYSERSFTTAGTSNFVVPAGCTRIRVCVIGGGGGGAGAATRSPSQSYTGGTGGTSSISRNSTVLIRATGGTGGYANKNGSCRAGSGGSPNGRGGTTRSGTSGHSSTISGGAGWSLNFNQSSGSYGSGGGAVASSYTSWLGSGGSGGYNTSYINVTPGETLSVTVGNYGRLGDTDDSRAHGYNGAVGAVLIAYGADVN